jgi:hypothetical protein
MPPPCGYSGSMQLHGDLRISRLPALGALALGLLLRLAR